MAEIEFSEGIPLDESGYGSGQHAIVVLSGARADIKRTIAGMNWRRSGDNPGQIFAWSCKVLKWYKGDYDRWQAVCLSSSYRDI